MLQREVQEDPQPKEQQADEDMTTMESTEAVPGQAEIRRQADKDGLHKRRGIWHYKLKIAGKWKEFSTRQRNFQEARKVYRDAQHAQDENRLPTDMSKWPFEKALQSWRTERDMAVARNTRRIDRERSKPLLAVFGGTRLCEIGTNEIHAYRSKRATTVSNRTINLEVKVLRMVLKQAKLWSRIAEDCKPLPENKRGPGRALLPDEEKRLFEIASSNPDWFVAYNAALVAANTTARGCELKGLRLADVDLNLRTMTVRSASAKTAASVRVIPLNETAAFAMEALIERARTLGANDPNHFIVPAIKSRAEKIYVFSKPTGSWRKAWGTLTKAAGLTGFRFHDLRHHCITRMAENGVPEQTLMALAGHISRQMLEHYSHVRMQAKREAVAALDVVSPPTRTKRAEDRVI
jgi:integrase